MGSSLKKKAKIILLAVALLLVLPGMALAQVHTVSKGDTIGKISQWYNINQFALRYLNNIWNDYIYVGQTIGIPGKYTVKKGDTLTTIARKYGVNAQNVKTINQLKSDVIYPGQALYIPSSGLNNTIAVSRGGRISTSDLDVLARIITAESDSESYQTQVAVGAVVLNRVDSPLFPNTIPGVVYQIDGAGRYQFEPVLNGWINRPSSESGKKAAMDALRGWDPSGGSLFFFESWVTNKYLTARPVSKVMDSFIFTY